MLPIVAMLAACSNVSGAVQVSTATPNQNVRPMRIPKIHPGENASPEQLVELARKNARRRQTHPGKRGKR